MTPRPLNAKCLRLALTALLFCLVGQAAPEIGEVREARTFEFRAKGAAMLDLLKSRDPKTFQEGSVEKRLYNEFTADKGPLGDLFKAWDPSKPNRGGKEIPTSSLEALGRNYHELAAAGQAKAELYTRFEGMKSGKVGSIDLAAGLDKLSGQTKARVFTNEAQVNTVAKSLEGVVPPKRIAEILGSEGAVRRSMSRDHDLAYGDSTSAMGHALEKMVALETNAARLSRDTGEIAGEFRPEFKDSKDPAVLSDREAGKALRDAMRMANGDPSVLGELGNISAKLNTPENRDAISGLGIMSRAMELSRSTAPTEKMYEDVARDNMGGGVSDKVIKEEAARLKAMESADIESARKFTDAAGLKTKIDTKGSRDATELLGKVDKEIERLSAVKPSADLQELSRLQQVRAHVQEAAEFESSKKIVADSKLVPDAASAKSMPELLGKVEAKLAELEAIDAKLLAAGKAPLHAADIARLKELRDELHLRRLAAFMRTNPRFAGMSKIQQFHTILCEAKAAGMRGPKILAAAMFLIGLPVAAWSAIAKGEEPKEADYKGPVASREQCATLATKFKEKDQDVSNISLFGPAATGPAAAFSSNRPEPKGLGAPAAVHSDKVDPFATKKK